MKKKLFSTILTGALLLGASTLNRTYAQFETENLSFGAGIGFTGQAGFGASLSLNLRGHYLLDVRNCVTLGYNTQLPLENVSDLTAHAYSSTTTPGSTDVRLTQRVALQNISAEYHRYLVADANESFGVYGLAGVGLTLATVRNTYSDYNKSLYDVGPKEESLVIVPGLVINAGLGSNMVLSDEFSLFGEVRLGIPAGNSYNSRGNSEINNPIPFNFGILLGVRYSPFN
jgi:hypothetical protein